MGTFRSTFRPQFGPVQVNTGMHGVTSVNLRLLGVTFRLWSRDGKQGVSSVDLPGPISYQPKMTSDRSRSRDSAPASPWSLNPDHPNPQ